MQEEENLVGFCTSFLGVSLVALYVLWGFSGLFGVFCSGFIRLLFFFITAFLHFQEKSK